MARLTRLFVEGEPQHLVQRGNNHERIFRCEHDYRMFRRCLVLGATAHGVAVHAYVLMPDHFHLLATPATANSIPKALQSVGRRYVQYFNACYQRSGTLWEGRYRATVLDSQRYLLACMRYIERNPVRAGLVERPESYAWSSCGANALGVADAMLSPHALYLCLGDDTQARAAAYLRLLTAALPEDDLQAIRDATNKGWALGDEAFRVRLTHLTGRRAAPLRAGRPRRADDQP